MLNTTRLAAAARWVLMASFFVGVASCRSDEAEPLRIGVNPWPGYELFFLAQELRFFQAEGVDVQLVEQLSLKDSRRVFVRGMVDGMFGTPMDLAVIQVGQVRPAKACWAFSVSAGGDAIVAREPHRALADLRGKRVAIEQGLGDYFLARALESAGMSLADVEVVYLPYAAADEALRSGEVEAIHTYSPIFHRLTQHGDQPYHVLFTSRELPDEIVDLLIVGPEVAEERAADLRGLERAYDRACRFVEEKPEMAFQIMAEREGVSPDEMANSFRNDLTLIPASDRAAYLAPDGGATLARERFHAMIRASRANLPSAADTTDSPAPRQPASTSTDT